MVLITLFHQSVIQMPVKFSLDGKCTDKESTNSDVDVDRNNNININIGLGKKLQEVFTKAIKAQNDWDTQFNLDVFVYGALVKKFNVLDAISIDKRLVPPHIYFNPQIFNHVEGFYGKGWKDLLQHLEIESFYKDSLIIPKGMAKQVRINTIMLDANTVMYIKILSVVADLSIIIVRQGSVTTN